MYSRLYVLYIFNVTNSNTTFATVSLSRDCIVGDIFYKLGVGNLETVMWCFLSQSISFLQSSKIFLTQVKRKY